MNERAEVVDDKIDFGNNLDHYYKDSLEISYSPMRHYPVLLAALAPLFSLTLALILAATLTYPLIRLSAGHLGVGTALSRGTLAILFLGLIWLMRHLGLRWKHVGLPANITSFARQIGLGLVFGILMLGLHVTVLLALDIRILSETQLAHRPIPALMAKNLGVGLLVATSEELLFRGLTFAILQKFVAPTYAVFITAFYYTIPHFLSSRTKFAAEDLSWDVGFRLLVHALEHGAQTIAVDSFLALLCAGIFLGFVRCHFPRGLGYCIGIHAGWVAVIRTTKALTYDGNAGSFGILVGSYDGIVGYLAAAWMVACIFLLRAAVAPRFPALPAATPEK
ncbi:MAG TPA: CPBP family intramembrane glutamic endopeptidase [Methylococcus sp.]|nr:CPBP family intramembrane glutamic endopeptidase [Methylococcus sp.]